MKAGLTFKIFLLAAWTAHGQADRPVPAQHAALPWVDLFSSIDRSVATVGESVMLTVEMLASPEQPAEARAIRKAFLALKPDLPESDFALVRTYEPEESVEHLDLDRSRASDLNLQVVHLRRQFVIRPKTDGLLEVPSLSVEVDGRSVSAPPHGLHVYRLEADFVAAQRAVLPLVVESRLNVRPLRRFIGTGSGFLIADNALVTAYHVVVNADRITATLPNGRRVRIKKVWAVDPARDVAVLHIDPGDVRDAGVRPLEIAPRQPISSRIRPVETDRVVFTTGWPEGVQQSGAGVLFHVAQYYDDDAIWLSSNRVRPGDSGGPLLDRRGRVVGVVSYGMSGGARGTPMLENVATATDPRPALAERLIARRPYSLKSFRDADFFDRYPQARAVKVMSLLTEMAHLRRRTDPLAVDYFLDELDTAVRQSYGASRLHFLQGSIYQMLGNFDEASNAYERALGERTEHYPAAYSLAYCQLAMREYEEAADLFDFTKHFEPYRGLAEYGLAQAKMQLLQYDDAIHHLRKVIHEHHDFAPAVYLLGRAHIGKGDDVAAARILVKLGRLSHAWAELLERSIRLSPFRPVTREEVRKATVLTLE